MPCFDGEMFGVTKVPNGVTRLTPPASTSRASPLAPGAAWQEAQPPCQKMLMPRCGSPGAAAASFAGSTWEGAESSQNPAPPISARMMMSNASLRIILLPSLS